MSSAVTPLQAASLEIESSDVVKLVLQFLKENNLHSSLRALQEESQVTLNTVDNIDKFVSDISHGRWDAVLEATANLRLTHEVLMDLFEQVVVEMAELRELDTARAILRGTPAMQQLKKEHPDRYLRLEHLLQRTYFDPSEAYPAGTNKESRRQALAVSLKQEVSVVPPSRLLALVGQALKWQQHQGLLPKGTRFDVLRGAAAIEAVEEEKPPQKNHKIIKFGKKSHPETARFSPDGLWLVSGSSDGFVEVWDYDSGKLAKELKYQAEDEIMMHDSAVLALCFSPDSELLATADASGLIKVWRIKTGSCVRKFQGAHSKGITSLEFSRDGTQLLSGSFDQTARIHGLKSGRMLKEFRGHSSFVNTVLYSEDCSQILTGSSDGTVKLWDSKTTDCIKTWKPIPNAQNAVTVSGLLRLPRFPDRIFVATRSPMLRVTTFEGQLTSQYQISQGDITHFTVSPKGNFVYAVGSDFVLYCFGGESTKLENAIKLHEKEVNGVVHHPHRNIMASFSHDGTLKIWRP